MALFLSASISLKAQNEVSKGVKELDKAIESGLEAVKAKKWDIALSEFAKARKLQEKENISQFLLKRVVLPDENRTKTDLSKEEQQINYWRHSMGTAQAIRVFQTYTASLAGNRVEADKFSKEVYGLQSPLWGLSWRTFNPAIFDLFNRYVTAEQREGYGVFLYLAGDLLTSSSDERGIELIEKAQTYLPKDAEIAANLAGIYIMADRPGDAKKQAELSLKIKPGVASVHIDLANAEWILGNLAAAKTNALVAKQLKPELPGPNATLAFVAIEEGDLKAAKEFADKGSEVSKNHPFFETVRAASEAAAGDLAKARSIMKDAWGTEIPSKERLEEWFFRRKPLEYLLRLK